jgi:hypothetical protein
MSRPKPYTLLGLRLRYWLLTFLTSGAILVIRLGIRTPGRFAGDVGAVGAYITAIGTLYGILAAFTIFVVWGQFNDAQNAVEAEANELLDLFRFSIYLRDRQALAALGGAIKEYASSVAAHEWPAMSSGKSAVQTVAAFEAVFQAVHAVRFDDERDAFAWEKMIAKFEGVSDSRSKRLDLAFADVPSLLQGLLWLVSISLVLGFFLLGIGNDIIAVVVTIATTAVVFLVVEVVEDLDDPFGGHWSMSPKSFARLPEQVDALMKAA